MRLDLYLVEKGIYTTRSKAQLAIKAGDVLVNGRKAFKSGQIVEETDKIDVNKTNDEFVGRGGLKLKGAIEYFKLNLKDLIVLDIGASTGGFTDCALKNGAKKVYAYDVGHDQIDKSLREDSRVVVKEGINCRYLKKEDFKDTIDFICMDVSFISCTKMFEAISNVLTTGKKAVILFKPQFEVGSDYLNRQGIVTSGKMVEEKMNYAISYAKSLGLKLVDKTTSPIKGGDGNTEYLFYLIKE